MPLRYSNAIFQYFQRYTTHENMVFKKLKLASKWKVTIVGLYNYREVILNGLLPQHLQLETSRAWAQYLRPSVWPTVEKLIVISH